MGFSNRVSDKDLNYKVMIKSIRNDILKEQAKIQKDIIEPNKVSMQLRRVLKVHIRRYLQNNNPQYMPIIDEILEKVYSELYGLGIMDKYLAIKTVTDVICFGKKVMYIDNGVRKLAAEEYNSYEEVKVVYKKIVANAGLSISTQEPSTDAELLDGSRVLIIIEPESAVPYIVIRKHTKSKISIDDLVLNGLNAPLGEKNIKPKKSLSDDLLKGLDISIRDYLKQAIIDRKNIVFVGGTGSGKTTFMNSLTYYIPENHIVAVLEDTRELDLPLPYVYYLKTRKGDGDKVRDITYEDILKDCLRANPDRIMLTEIRSGESAYALLQVLNSGHGGSMTSIHANGAMEAIDRLEELITEYKNIPKSALKGLISKAIDIVIYLGLDEDEKGNKVGRGIKEIVEIKGMDKMKEEYLIDFLYVNK